MVVRVLSEIKSTQYLTILRQAELQQRAREYRFKKEKKLKQEFV